MVPSTLGKRSRSTVEAAEPQPVATRSKRRIVVNGPNDENCNIFVRPDHDRHHQDGSEVDESLPPAKKSRRIANARSVPAKHGAPEQRVPVSPSNIDSHFKIAKAFIPVFEDGKSSHISTPTTPRHRDALSKKVPVTPRHRVLLAGSTLTPRTPKIPSTPSTSANSVYHHARQLFSRCSSPGKLVGREEERNELSTFVDTCLRSKSTGCIYVSGPPGTGKSALVEEVLQQFKDSPKVTQSVVNCMSIKSAKDLSAKLTEDLALGDDAGPESLKSCFIRGRARDDRKYLVILDEVDRLVDLDLTLLYNLFEWSMHASSRLNLIGIANALDLTDRFLPRLKSRSLKPELLPFMPYSAAQIAEVLTTKLKSLSAEATNAVPFLHPAAIQFCAKKVAAQTGDLRKAFDLCRRAMDLVEQETKEKDVQDSPSKTPLMENINLSSPPTPRSPTKTRAPASYTIETAPKATIAHMAKVTAQVFGNGTTQRLATLNLQQKAVLCALAALERRKRESQVEKTMFATPSKHNTSAPSIKQLFDAYSSFCKREKLLHPLTTGEFRDVVSGLETFSLVSSADSRTGSFAIPLTPSKTPSRRGKGGFATTAVGDDRRVASVVGCRELSSTLEGAGGELLRDILNGDGLDL
ncbi:AAA ATPase [Vermiconidia calcicola]|uniref:AAA ATPase n=1 Tax=Vermiconidia calcicola TaxID=1690605 RepID=A0ACC3MNS7_9PEZI|nr:AAA ATPase [Vermiconidia calcicola]